MEATALLKKDHDAVKALFKKYEGVGDSAEQTKQSLFDQIQAELDVHTTIEEQIFYPAVQEGRSAEAKDMVLEALEEHKVVKTLLEEIASLTPVDEEFDAKMKVLQENVEHHADEEEKEMFPEAKKQLSEEVRNELGARMETRKHEL
jgi:iron-sulfur cluster repair protein YtfE (RIC family)